MGKREPKRGRKRECPECGARFYDLERDPIVCPKCEAPYVEAGAKTAGTAAGDPAGEGAKPASTGSAGANGPEKEDGDAAKLPDMDIDGDEEDDGDDDLIEDATELVKESDDVSDVLDGTVDDGKTEE